jgi:hypothetical protein
MTLRNTSSQTAVALNSMFVVTGVRYSAVVTRPARSNASTLRHEIATGKEIGATPQRVDVRYAGVPTRSVLSVGHIVEDKSFLYPKSDFDRTIVVAIPTAGVQELDVQLAFDYSREARLRPGRETEIVHLLNHPKDPDCVASAWVVHQSELLQVTRGTEQLFAYWCAPADNEHIETYVGGAPGKMTPLSAVARNTAEAQFVHATRQQMLLLP